MGTRGTACWLAGSLLLALRVVAEVTYGSVRNGDFGLSRTLRPDDPLVVESVKARWTLPPDLLLPAHWGPNANTPGGALQYLPNSGWLDSPCVRLGGGGHIASYFGLVKPATPYLAALRVRGHGDVWFGLYEYDEVGQVGGAALVVRPVASAAWREYRGLYANTNAKVKSVNLALAGNGPVDVDEVSFAPASPADLEITREMIGMYGSGALVEDPGIQAVRVDGDCKGRLEAYAAALAALRRNQAAVDPALFASLQAKAAALEPYLRGADKTAILAAYYNEMTALTQALQRLAGGSPGPATAAAVEPVQSGAGYRPGERAARPGVLTVTDLRSNKVRYDENENATAVVTLVNASAAPLTVTAVATLVAGLDGRREVARQELTLAPGETLWRFGYNVGPETYGRALEVQCLNANGEVLDRWQEYYAVAAEWFRVQQHSGQAALKSYRTDERVTYVNQVHYFANEPTDFGVQAGDFEEYLSPQAGYHIIMGHRKNRIAAGKAIGVMSTIYQNSAYSGHMGYEMIRQHPEFALYDANGQFAVDPVYGGVPNPMEIASPIEIGPKRQVTKPYLDRRITPWGHGLVNTAMQEVIEFEAHRVRDYAAWLGFSGVYTDGNWGVVSGYGYDGKPNLPSREPLEIMRLNARNHRVFSAILKEADPNFGTWYNWAYSYCDYMLALGQRNYLGSGVKGDVGDETIRAAAVRNTMFLLEIQDTFRKTDSPWTSPAYHLNMLADNRDLMVQKYGCNVIIGYQFPWADAENPGANRWGWPTLNYFGAQLIAAQHHFAGGFVPSMRPWLQFQTRYSRYVWAPDVKVVAEPEKIVQVAAPEALWWQRFVYRLRTDQGDEVIVHLIRIPPTPTWDVDWLDEPAPLRATVRVRLGPGSLRDAWALRPYDYPEEQQTVQTLLTPRGGDRGEVSVEVPPFRYHTLLIFRSAERTGPP